jgi:hypothetical protein
MFLPALVAVSGLVGGGWSAPAAAAPAAVVPAAAPRYEPALEVTIDSLTPSYLPAEGPVRVTGSVTNVQDLPWRTVNIYPFLDDAPMLTPAELAVAADADPLLAVGERITDMAASTTIDLIPPGETERFSLAVPRSLLETDGAGVYWFGIHAMGESDEQPRDDLADGRARTFLPYVPPGTPGAVKTALVLPVRHVLDYADDGSLRDLEHWRRTLSVGGRLRDLADFGASAGTTPVSWLVDPAVPDAVRRLGLGNPPRSLGPSERSPDEEEERDQTPSGEPSASAAPDGPAGDARELGPEERAVAEAAMAWLDRLEEAVRGNEVFTLPYGDLDVSAAAELDQGLYDLARDRPSDVLTDWSVPTRPAVASPTGYLNEAGFGLVGNDTTTMITDRMFTEDPPGVAEVGGRPVAVTSSGAASGGPRPGDRFTSLQLRQRILSEAAVRLLTPGRHPLVVPLPLEWHPDQASAFFAGLKVDWLDLTTVTDAIDRGGRKVDPAELDYPLTQLRRQLDAPEFAAVRDLISAGEILQNVLTLNSAVSDTVTGQALAGASYASREAPLAARASLVRSRAWISDALASVDISAGPGVTLSGSNGGFAAVITNDLDQPVTVDVVARSNGGVEIAPVDPVALPANSRSTVVLEAHANRVGVTNVTLALTDVDGNPIGSTDQLPIRSAQVSVVIWLIIGTGLGLLFLAILVRLFRRVRGGSAEPVAPLEPTT